MNLYIKLSGCIMDVCSVLSSEFKREPGCVMGVARFWLMRVLFFKCKAVIT